MKDFRELYIRGEKAKIFAVAEKIRSSLTGGDWQEAEPLDGPVVGKEWGFRCPKTDTLEAASLWLMERRGGNELHVSNIVPEERGQLSFDQYNAIVKEFHDRLAKPAADELGVEVELTPDEVSVESCVSAETADKLRSFSRSANRSTGSAHPMDETRWFDFIVSAFVEKAALNASVLQRLLQEEEGWPEDSAYRLSSEFEHYYSLLRYLRKKGMLSE